MALTAYGFTGTIDNVEWANISRLLGAEYAVGGSTDFEVQTVAGQDRTVRILPGEAFAHGVRVDNDATPTLQLPVIASGSRWDLVCLRRNWASAGAVSLTSVNGTSAAALPAGRNATPGILDDQPLALVQVTAGQTLPTGVVDLRVWPSKVLTAATLLALPNARKGTIAQVGALRYRRDLVSGNLAWVQEAAPSATFKRASDGTQTPATVAQGSLTGAGVGRTILVQGSVRYRKTSTTGNTTWEITVDGQPAATFGPYVDDVDTEDQFLSLSGAITSTATNPVIVLRGSTTAGSLNVRTSSHVTATAL